MEAKLVIVSGAAKTGEFALKLPTVIGRSRNVDLPLGHALVSRQHCKLFEADGVLKLKDLGSLNGTFVDEQRITEETVLLSGAEFTVGPVTFRAVYGEMSTLDESPDFSSVSDFELPPQAGEPSQAEAPAPAAAASPPTANAEAKPASSVASEQKTEALKPLNAGETPENLSAPDSPGNADAAEFDPGQFDWLEQSTAAPAAAADSDTSDAFDFMLADKPSDTPGVDTAQTVEDSPPDKEASEASPASKREAKKPPSKGPMMGLFGRGSKSEKQKAAAKDKEKDKEKPKSPPAETAEKEPVETKPATDSPAKSPVEAKETADEELDFTLPPAGNEGSPHDSGLKNSLDFLN